MADSQSVIGKGRKRDDQESYRVFTSSLITYSEHGLCAILFSFGWNRAVSSAGRASRSQRGGRGFESLTVHHSFFSLTIHFLHEVRRVLSGGAQDFRKRLFRFPQSLMN